MLPILGATLAQQLGEAAVGAQASWRTDCALLGHDGRFALRDHAGGAQSVALDGVAPARAVAGGRARRARLPRRDARRPRDARGGRAAQPLSVVLRLQGTPIDRTVMLDGGEGCWAWHDDPPSACRRCAASVRSRRRRTRRRRRRRPPRSSGAARAADRHELHRRPPRLGPAAVRGRRRRPRVPRRRQRARRRRARADGGGADDEAQYDVAQLRPATRYGFKLYARQAGGDWGDGETTCEHADGRDDGGPAAHRARRADGVVLVARAHAARVVDCHPSEFLSVEWRASPTAAWVEMMARVDHGDLPDNVLAIDALSAYAGYDSAPASTASPPPAAPPSTGRRRASSSPAARPTTPS